MLKLRRWRMRWPVLLAAAAALVVAGFAARFAAASYYAAKSPLLAAELDPGNGIAAGKAVALLQSVDPENYRMEPAEREMLLNGLKRDPLSKSALRAWGIAEFLAKDEPGAATFMTLAQRVSRREAATQLWMVNDKARKGNLAGAIKHYDRALSVSPSAANLLFPSLTQALKYPEIDAELAPYLHNGRSWADAFVLYATENVERVTDLGRLLQAAEPLPDSPEREIILQQVVQRYAAQGDIRGGSAFATRMMGADPRVLNAFPISDATTSERFAPLTWTLSESGSIVSAFADAGVEVVAAPDTSGTVLTRMMYLPQGVYTLAHSVAYPEKGQALELEWQTSCLRGETMSTFWTQTVPSLQQDSRYSMTLAVPAGCGGVRILLNVKDTERADQAYIVIDNLELTPARAEGNT